MQTVFVISTSRFWLFWLPGGRQLRGLGGRKLRARLSQLAMIIIILFLLQVYCDGFLSE